MKMEFNDDIVVAVVLIIVGALFIFKPELVGIIIGLFLIVMGINLLTKTQTKGRLHGRRKAS
jgi:multisubunit Na+/H+ antiporter MnhC subunit